MAMQNMQPQFMSMMPMPAEAFQAMQQQGMHPEMMQVGWTLAAPGAGPPVLLLDRFAAVPPPASAAPERPPADQRRSLSLPCELQGMPMQMMMGPMGMGHMMAATQMPPGMMPAGSMAAPQLTQMLVDAARGGRSSNVFFKTRICNK